MAPQPLDIERLFDEHADFVRALARNLLGNRPEVDDVVQEVFLLAWRKREEYRGGSERCWLGQMTVRVAANARRPRFLRFLGLEAARDTTVDLSTPERSAVANEALRLVDAALRAMSTKRRVVFTLFEIHGFTGEEIAETLGCPLQTVHTRLFYARREFLARVGPDVLDEWLNRRK